MSSVTTVKSDVGRSKFNRINNDGPETLFYLSTLERTSRLRRLSRLLRWTMYVWVCEGKGCVDRWVPDIPQVPKRLEPNQTVIDRGQNEKESEVGEVSMGLF